MVVKTTSSKRKNEMISNFILNKITFFNKIQAIILISSLCIFFKILIDLTLIPYRKSKIVNAIYINPLLMNCKHLLSEINIIKSPDKRQDNSH